MPSEILDRVAAAIADGRDASGWCSRAQVESLLGATSIDKREVDRALRVGVANGRLEREGDDYRVTDA